MMPMMLFQHTLAPARIVAPPGLEFETEFLKCFADSVVRQKKPKFLCGSLVLCKLEGELGSIEGVVVECIGSSVTVLDTSNQVRTFEDASVKEVKASFDVVSQDRNGRTVRCERMRACVFFGGKFWRLCDE